MFIINGDHCTTYFLTSFSTRPAASRAIRKVGSIPGGQTPSMLPWQFPGLDVWFSLLPALKMKSSLSLVVVMNSDDYEILHNCVSNAKHLAHAQAYNLIRLSVKLKCGWWAEKWVIVHRNLWGETFFLKNECCEADSQAKPWDFGAKQSKASTRERPCEELDVIVAMAIACLPIFTSWPFSKSSPINPWHFANVDCSDKKQEEFWGKRRREAVGKWKGLKNGNKEVYLYWNQSACFYDIFSNLFLLFVAGFDGQRSRWLGQQGFRLRLRLVLTAHVRSWDLK